MVYKILIVEDDLVIAKAIRAHLQSWGCEAQCAADFQNVLGNFAAFDPQLVLLDISLPFYNGYHWCGEIRKISKVPVIFISSASDNMNIVMAMNMGGDDFITKPYDLNVVTAKIQAVLRRTYSYSEHPGNLCEYRGGILNVNDQTFTYEGKKAELTKNEFRILQILMENTGKVVSRDKIMEKLWEDESFIDDNTLTVNVTRLRKKLEETGIQDYIKTKKGTGYLIE